MPSHVGNHLSSLWHHKALYIPCDCLPGKPKCPMAWNQLHKSLLYLLYVRLCNFGACCFSIPPPVPTSFSLMCLLMNVRASNFLRCWFARQESQKRTPPTHISSWTCSKSSQATAPRSVRFLLVFIGQVCWFMCQIREVWRSGSFCTNQETASNLRPFGLSPQQRSC